MHADGQGHLQVVEAVLLPVADGPVGEQRGIAPPAGIEQVVFTADIEKSFLLAGKTGFREILCLSADSLNGPLLVSFFP